MKFGYVANQQQATSPKVVRAYHAGRAASVAAAAITTNPHVSGTPEWVAWRNGHNTYTSGGANTPRDGPAQLPAFANPAVTMANVTADTTGATWGATPAAPGLPFRIDWGDGKFSDNPAATTTQIQHVYAASGSYKTRLLFADKVWDEETLTVTVTP
jgi:hypothetical protein